MLGELSAAGWVLKKPTSQASKPWAGAQLQKRFLETSGLIVPLEIQQAPVFPMPKQFPMPKILTQTNCSGSNFTSPCGMPVAVDYSRR